MVDVTGDGGNGLKAFPDGPSVPTPTAELVVK